MDGLAPDASALFERAMQIFADRAKRYGTDNIAKAGPSGVLARIRDKLARAENLLDEGTPEMAIDTALDLANYGIILASLAAQTWPSERKECLVLKTETPHIHPPQRVGDVGFDLVAAEARTIRPLTPTYIPTGVRLALPDGVWCTIVGRSSLLRKYNSMVPTCVIDNGYTGELQVCIVNYGDAFTVKKGARLAQVIFHRVVTPQLQPSDVLPETDRGEAAFGSTGE